MYVNSPWHAPPRAATEGRACAAAEEAIDRMAEGMSPMQALFEAMLNAAMLLERERHLEARPHERTEGRQGYANGFKSKCLDTYAGTLHLSVPKTAQRGKFDREPFHPSCLEKGMHCERALMLTIAKMYVRGVSTRRIKGILGKMGVEGISSSQVSRAAKKWTWNSIGGGSGRWERRGTFSSTPTTRRCATATPPSSLPSASSPTGSGAFWAFSSSYRRPRSTGATSSTASSPARRRVHRLRRPCQAGGRPQGGLPGRDVAALPVPSRPERLQQGSGEDPRPDRGRAQGRVERRGCSQSPKRP